MSAISQGIHRDPLPRDSKFVMVQVGWLAGSNTVYALDDQPFARESNWTPLYIAIGIWEDLGDGHWGIKD